MIVTNPGFEPKKPNLEEVLRAVNKAGKEELIAVNAVGYVMVFSEQINQLWRDFKAVENESFFGKPEEHPAYKILLKLYPLVKQKIDDTNADKISNAKRAEARSKNDTMIRNKVQKIEEEFLQALINLEYETEGLERTVIVDKLCKRVDYAELHQGVIKLRDEKESA